MLNTQDIYDLNLEVSLNDEQCGQIEEFVKKRFGDAKHYSENRNAYYTKIEDDLRVGAIGEFLTFNGLIQLGFEFKEPPDMTHYSIRNKNWKADLIGVEKEQEYNLHVKATRGFRGQSTWTFNLKDKGKESGMDPLLTTSEGDLNNYLSLVHVTSNTSGKIMVIGQWHTFKKYLKDPILADKKGLKICLYYPFDKMEKWSGK